MNGGSRTERARLWADVYLALFEDGDDGEADGRDGAGTASDSASRARDSDKTG